MKRDLWTRPLACALLLASGLSAQVTVFSHATVIDGSGRAPLRDGTLVVGNGRIDGMGPAAKVKTPHGAQVIDLSGQTIIPGIINLHSHIGQTRPAEFAPMRGTASPARPDWAAMATKC